MYVGPRVHEYFTKVSFFFFLCGSGFHPNHIKTDFRSLRNKFKDFYCLHVHRKLFFFLFDIIF